MNAARNEDAALARVLAIENVKLPEGYDPQAFTMSDLGNAERLAVRHGIDLHFCHPMKTWFVYDGKRWAEDASGEINRRAAETVRSIYVHALSFEGEQREKLLKHALASEKAARLSGMIDLARSLDEIPVHPHQLDADANLLNLQNGTLELDTLKFRRYRREDLISKIAGAEFNPEAECPVFLAFLTRICGGDESLVGFLQRAMGYALTGHAKAQCFFVLWGTGANGKSTFLEIIRTVLGDYAVKAAFDSFLVGKSNGSGPSPDIARLRGARFACAVEADASKRLDEARIKELTGGDTMTARKLHQDFFEFQPVFKLFLAANHKPEIRGTDEGIWRRVHMVPFTVQIPPDERDPELLDKMRGELAGILNFALAGLRDFQEHGLAAPPAVKDATETYRREMDTFQEFLDERCRRGVHAKVRSSDLLEAHNAWAKAQGYPLLSSRSLPEAMREHGFECRKSSGMWWLGLWLASADELNQAADGADSATGSGPTWTGD